MPAPGSVYWPSAWSSQTLLSVEISEATLMDDATPKGMNHCQIDFASEDCARDWHIEFDLTIDDRNDSFGIVTARPMQGEVDTPQVYVQIKQWLQRCQQHSKCSLQRKPYSSQPSRLIEVSPVDSPDRPRLTSPAGFRASYLALSYCWGSGQSCIMNTENIGSLTQALDLNVLPRTIIDAIKVTRSLGFAYLWVDALCIIQDSNEDKSRELSMMHAIYENATVTVVAACSASVSDGFLEARSSSRQASFDIPCRLGFDQYFIAHLKEHSMYDDKLEPVNKRALAYQEALLSPRLLIYASHTLQWQCRALTCNLGDSYHAPNPSAKPRLPELEKFEHHEEGEELFSSMEYLHEEDLPHPILQPWLSFVQAYCDRKLTLPGDKLAAISALASWYAPHFEHEYHAGIWRKSAVQQLCWRRPDRRRFFTKSLIYRAPSWSWAALDGAIYFPSYPASNEGSSVCIRHPEFAIKEWETERKANHVPYGEVTDGRLVVHANILDATFEPSSSSDTNLFFGSTQIASVVNYRAISHSHGLADTLEENFTRTVRCLALYLRDGTQQPLSGGLMLVEDSALIGCYRRIGSFVADSGYFSSLQVETLTIV